MGLEYENVGTPVVLDIETCAHEGAADFLPPPDLDHITPPSSYKREEAIADYVFRERVKRKAAHKDDLERCSLDPDLCRIVAIGVMQVTDIEPVVVLCPDEAAEKEALRRFWPMFRARQLVGFNIAAFDVLVLMRRSQLLGIKTPSIPLGKYRHPTVTDLLQVLTFDWQTTWRSQGFYLKRFGLVTEADPHVGADIARLVAEGNWDAIAHHVRCDVTGAMALARRLGVIQQQEV